MLVLSNSSTPKTTLESVIEYLNDGMVSYSRSAKAARLKRDAEMDTARANALRLCIGTLKDCDVMRRQEPMTVHELAREIIECDNKACEPLTYDRLLTTARLIVDGRVPASRATKGEPNNAA